MKLCPQCRREMPPVDAPPASTQGTANQGTAAQRSGASADDASAGEMAWTPIARLTNLAEVGFFADILEDGNIATNVFQHNEFSALDGSWNTVFVLRVPPADGKRAAQLLREELSQHSDEPDGSEPWSEPATRESVERGSLFTPVLLMLVAGGIGYFVGRGALARPSGPGASGAMMRALTESDRPWVLEDQSEPGGGTRRLQYIPETRTILLEQDSDGDGRWERRQRFDVPRAR